MNDKTDRSRNEQVAEQTRKVYIVATVIICLCLAWLKWGV